MLVLQNSISKLPDRPCVPAQLVSDKHHNKVKYLISGLSKIPNEEFVPRTRSCPIEIINKYKWLYRTNYNKYCWNMFNQISHKKFVYKQNQVKHNE